MRRSAAVLALLVGACVTFGGGSDYVDPTAGPSSRMSVAVLPFENLSTHPRAGLIVSQLVRAELYARGLFRQQEESETRRRLTQRRIDVSQLGERVAAADVASGLDVDAVLVGSVSEYRYQHGLKEEPAVGATARLVDRTGVVLWSGTRSTVGGGLVARASLSETARGLVGRMIDGLARHTRLETAGD